MLSSASVSTSVCCNHPERIVRKAGGPLRLLLLDSLFFRKLEIYVIRVCVFYLVVCVRILKFEGEVHELKSLHHMFPIEDPCVISFALCARIRTSLAGVVSRIW